MSRPLRHPVAGGLYHLVSRGNARATIYRDEHDRLQFFQCLDEALSTYAARCHAYCLMGNHYHLLVETSQPNLSLTMRQLNGVYGHSTKVEGLEREPRMQASSKMQRPDLISSSRSVARRRLLAAET